MDTLLKATTNLLPYHLLSYGALLGTELYQVFLLPPPFHLSLLLYSQLTIPELHQHQNLLPGPPHARIPHPPKTPLPHLLPNSTRSGRFDSPHTSAGGNRLVDEFPLGCGVAGRGGGYWGVELLGVWAEDYHGGFC